jgi:hypothetical protein
MFKASLRNFVELSLEELSAVRGAQSTQRTPADEFSDQLNTTIVTVIDAVSPFVGVAREAAKLGNPSSNGAWPPARRRARSAAPAVYTELLAAPGAGVGQCEGGRPPSPRSL